MDSETASEYGRNRLLSRRGEPLFYADWDRPLFLHYEIDADTLRRHVPFPLDLREGRAYVSLVAFTMRRMRFCFGGRVGEWLCRPIGTHEFLNVRTYVHHRGEPGIYFLAEWLPHPICAQLGPRTFGLPYRLGSIRYEHFHEHGRIYGSVGGMGSGGSFRYEATMEKGAEFVHCPPGSIEEFLLERYTAFTSRAGARRFFRIWHPPWHQIPVRARVLENSLLTRQWNWFSEATIVGANYSPGARNVWMGWPHRIRASRETPHHHRLSAFFELP